MLRRRKPNFVQHDHKVVLKKLFKKMPKDGAIQPPCLKKRRRAAYNWIHTTVKALTQLLDVVRGACKDGTKRRKRCQDELHRFGQELDENLQFANKLKEQAGAVGFKSNSLDKLQNELEKFVSSAKDLLSSNNCKKEDIQQLRECAMGTLQKQMGCILFEMCFKNCEDMKAIKEMLAKKQEMVSKNDGVHINIFQGQAHGYPMLVGLASYVTETLWECICRVLADEHLNLVVPTEEAGPYVHLFRVAGVEESGRIKEDAAKYVLKEEEEEKNKVFVRKQGAGKDVLEEKKRTKEILVSKEDMERPSAEKEVTKEDMERRSAEKEVTKEEEKKEAFLSKEGSGMDVLEEKENMKEALLEGGLAAPCTPLHLTTERQAGEEQDNPNSNMELIKEEGKGELLMYKLEGSHIEMIYTWCEESVGMVIGNSPMEVSAKLGYCYFEVKLVEMAELLEGSETGLAGIGVGLARLDKFRTSKMAGKYSKSCGYDGRVGEVYYENRVQEGPSRMGSLAMGDTLGIGLLLHHGQHHIFFAKNRKLQVCFQVGSLCTPSSHGGLYPVISLASSHVRLHVNFQGPFDLLELLMQVKAHKQRGKR